MQRLDRIIPGYHMHEWPCMHNFHPHASKAEAFVHMHVRTDQGTVIMCMPSSISKQLAIQ
jgi:hypothetical protein